MKKICALAILLTILILSLTLLVRKSALPTKLSKDKPKSIPPSSILPLPTGKNCQVTPLSKEKAFLILSSEKDRVLPSIKSESKEIENIPLEELEKIALSYGVIEKDECGPKIFVYLQKGKYIHLNELKGSNFERWYLTVNACVNNKRVVIDALTGEQVGPLHHHVICGGIV